MEKKKFLVAVDASDHAMETIGYVRRVARIGQCQVTLFHVENPIPEAFWDMGLGVGFQERMSSVRAWASENERAVGECLDAARSRLIQAGFSGDDVTVKKQPRSRGVARDILAEAARGYDLLIVGRFGVSRIKDFFVGNVASKLACRVDCMPLTVVGRYLNPDNILIAFDGSVGAMRGVESVSRLYRPEGVTIHLCYVLRSQVNLYRGYRISVTDVEQEVFEEGKVRIRPKLEKAVETLVDAGFDRDRVHTMIEENAMSRSYAIVEEARAKECGTIVVGRRGITAVEEFLMGRVSKKVFQMAEHASVWIVN